jgi:hypothetical protein
MSYLDGHILVAPTGYLNFWNISDERSEAPDVEMVGDLVNEIQTYSNVNPNQIRVLGSSNGSALANRVFIENKNAGVDAICAISSQLCEAQYHNGNFFYPSGATGGTDRYDGYDVITTPIVGRKYLGISNINDPNVPYFGGEAYGVNFLDAQDAIYIVAQSQGYSGVQLTGPGEQIGTSTVYGYSYLSDQAVLLKGHSGHQPDTTQKEYIRDFFSVGADLSPAFRRGDTNADSALDIADAIFTLSYLFASGTAPTCLDAADSNDDGEINVADAIFVLQYLFAGGLAIPPPYPECGIDPTVDELDCLAYRPCE